MQSFLPSNIVARRSSRLGLGCAIGIVAQFILVGSANAAVPAETISYQYDALGRLVAVSHAGAVNDGVRAVYSYDQAGNRSNVTVMTTSTKPLVEANRAIASAFTVDDPAVGEGGILVFTIVRSGDLAGTDTVFYRTEDGTGHAGPDYQAASGALTFAPGEKSKTVQVATSDNSTAPGWKSLSLSLSNPSPGASITKAQGTGWILDNDSSGNGVRFSVGDASVTEGGDLVFTITKTGSVPGSYSVIYATTSGTAIAMEDFYPVAGTLTFADGETSKTVAVHTFVDSVPEKTETMYFNLGQSTGGSTLSRAQAVGTILDNGRVPPRERTITLANATSLDLRQLADAGGYRGDANVIFHFVVPSGVVIVGAPGGGTALTTGVWPPGVTLTLEIDGAVLGGGGNGGRGGYGVTNGENGTIGGDALHCLAQMSVTVGASGALKGGGGGGGGGGVSLSGLPGGGGGGGAPNGRPGQAGGAGAGAGSAGSLAQGGHEGVGAAANPGGAGGAYAASGWYGTAGATRSGMGNTGGAAIPYDWGRCHLTNHGQVAGYPG